MLTPSIQKTSGPMPFHTVLQQKPHEMGEVECMSGIYDGEADITIATATNFKKLKFSKKNNNNNNNNNKTTTTTTNNNNNKQQQRKPQLRSETTYPEQAKCGHLHRCSLCPQQIPKSTLEGSQRRRNCPVRLRSLYKPNPAVDSSTLLDPRK